MSKNRTYTLLSDTPKSHAKVLLPMVDTLLDQASLELECLSAIAVSVGPGSFTGIRIALSVAQGLGYGLNIPLMGENSLEILAKTALSSVHSSDPSKHADSVIIPALDARMGEVYWAAYQAEGSKLTEIAAPTVSAPERLNQYRSRFAVEKVIACGHGWSVDQVIKDDILVLLPDMLPNAEGLLSLIQERGIENGLQDLESYQSVEPLYLRNEVSWDKRKRIRETKLV